jgi:hypothetical protein
MMGNLNYLEKQIIFKKDLIKYMGDMLEPLNDEIGIKWFTLDTLLWYPLFGKLREDIGIKIHQYWQEIIGDSIWEI